MALAAVAVGAAGATFDIVIDAYRIELLKPEQLGVGSGMSQYGWRIGSVAAGSLEAFIQNLPKVTSRTDRQLWLIKPDRNRAVDTDFLQYLAHGPS